MKEKLLKFLKNSPNDTWKLGNYILPTKLYSPRSKGSRVIDLRNFRKDSLKKISKHEQSVCNLLEPTKEVYIPEFPIPIYDKDLWLKLCRKWQVDEDEITGKTVLWIDFFFPYRQCVIEADGQQHHTDIIQYKSDLVRDDYLKTKYGILTYRFSKFLEDWGEGLRWMLDNTILEQNPMTFIEWSEGIVQSWKQLYSQELRVMKYLSTKSRKGIVYIERKALSFNTGGLIRNRESLERFNYIFHNLYGLIIQDI